jgi:hypothetical protein
MLFAAALLCGALSAPLTWPAGGLAQDVVTPAINDGGPRTGPEPTQAPALAYGVVILLLIVGVGIGGVAVMVIRRWDRDRPIERQSEARHGGRETL